MSAQPQQFEVSVLLFGSAAKSAGRSSVSVRLEHGSTAADLLAELNTQHPAIANEASVGRIAVNHAFVEPATPIEPGQELALIAMVSGG